MNKQEMQTLGQRAGILAGEVQALALMINKLNREAKGWRGTHMEEAYSEATEALIKRESNVSKGRAEADYIANLLNVVGSKDFEEARSKAFEAKAVYGDNEIDNHIIFQQVRQAYRLNRHKQEA